jgi:hypothetical protein
MLEKRILKNTLVNVEQLTVLTSSRVMMEEARELPSLDSQRKKDLIVLLSLMVLNIWEELSTLKRPNLNLLSEPKVVPQVTLILKEAQLVSLET